ncbi:MAG: glycosyltransferase [Candidatus Eisenbacteria bacterium]
MTIQRPPRRIAFFRHTLLPPSETFIADQAAYLQRYRPVFFGRERGTGRFALPEVHVMGRGGRDRFVRRFLYTLTGKCAGLLAEMEKTGPALVHGHFGVDSLYALSFARALGVPLITSFYGFDATRSRRSLLLGGKISHVRYALGMKRLIAEGARFIAITSFIKSQLVKRGFPEDRITVHPLGVDPERFTPAGKRDDGRTLITVGRLVPFKGTEYLIRAAAKAREAVPDLRVVIIGDGPLRTELQDLVTELGVEDNVEFLGVVSPERVSQEMRSASVFCFPSVTERDGHREGQGVALLEANATGLPLIGSRSGGIPDVIRDGENGFLVEERDIAGLADRMIRLLRDRELRDRIGAAGRRTVLERFDVRKLAARLEEIYDAVLER